MSRRTVHPVVIQLRTIREARGVSRPVAARLSGLSVHAIEGWEWGDRTPLLGGLDALAGALGYTLTLTPKEATTDDP